MSIYLCYDIRGIQSFIFRIPRLKYIIGGSALIDRFDRKTMPEMFDEMIKSLNISNETELLFAGGGKGTFLCQNEPAVSTIKMQIVKEAHDIGVDISFGHDSDFSKASRNATELFPCIPKSLEGIPCPVSGLYPVQNNEKVHSIVKKRIFNKGENDYEKMSHWFEKDLIKMDGESNNLHIDAEKARFFSNVNCLDEDGKPDKEGKIGAEVLGNRNRWAVICMDGNDMGSQLHHMANVEKLPSNKMTVWVKAMSEAIDNCVRGATKFAIAAVIDSWMKSKDYTQKKDSEGNTILPIRPIVVGGDDISVLCHVSYAMTFVEKVVEQFKELSKKHNETFLKEHGYDLWPATGGKLSISAGVLFCPVNLPLHTAIEYAESLLASAKSRGRKDPVVDEPSLECIDWEHITDSIIDTPSARRQREMIYKDTDSGREVHLTNRPCTINEFQGIKELAEKYGSETDAGVPATIRHKVLPAMRKGLYDRLAFIAEIAKHQPILAAHLSEEGYEISPEKTKWDYSESGKQKTPVIDALLLLEEIQRMSKETNNVK